MKPRPSAPVRRSSRLNSQSQNTPFQKLDVRFSCERRTEPENENEKKTDVIPSCVAKIPSSTSRSKNASRELDVEFAIGVDKLKVWNTKLRSHAAVRRSSRLNPELQSVPFQELDFGFRLSCKRLMNSANKNQSKPKVAASTTRMGSAAKVPCSTIRKKNTFGKLDVEFKKLSDRKSDENETNAYNWPVASVKEKRKKCAKCVKRITSEGGGKRLAKLKVSDKIEDSASHPTAFENCSSIENYGTREESPLLLTSFTDFDAPIGKHAHAYHISKSSTAIDENAETPDISQQSVALFETNADTERGFVPISNGSKQRSQGWQKNVKIRKPVAKKANSLRKFTPKNGSEVMSLCTLFEDIRIETASPQQDAKDNAKSPPDSDCPLFTSQSSETLHEGDDTSPDIKRMIEDFGKSLYISMRDGNYSNVLDVQSLLRSVNKVEIKYHHFSKLEENWHEISMFGD